MCGWVEGGADGRGEGLSLLLGTPPLLLHLLIPDTGPGFLFARFFSHARTQGRCIQTARDQ